MFFQVEEMVSLEQSLPADTWLLDVQITKGKRDNISYEEIVITTRGMHWQGPWKLVAGLPAAEVNWKVKLKLLDSLNRLIQRHIFENAFSLALSSTNPFLDQ